MNLEEDAERKGACIRACPQSSPARSRAKKEEARLLTASSPFRQGSCSSARAALNKSRGVTKTRSNKGGPRVDGPRTSWRTPRGPGLPRVIKDTRGFESTRGTSVARGFPRTARKFLFRRGFPRRSTAASEELLHLLP